MSVAAAAAGQGAPRAQPLVRTALVVGWAIALVAWVAVAARLAAIPPALSSDDALFLLHGLTRFSILDFSPQFPGYPGLVAMGRLLLPFAGDPLAALALLTALVALALPPVAALAVWRTGRSRWAALMAFALTLAGPLMPDLALSLLSDGAGILFLLVFLALLPVEDDVRPRVAAFLAGAALAWAAACRPSDAALFAGALAGAAIVAPRRIMSIVAGGLAVAVPVAAVVLALEGPLVASEGARFFAGNALIWGNTPFAPGGRSGGWPGVLSSLPFGWMMAALIAGGVAAALPLARRAPALAAAVGAFAAHAAWIALFQNPDHLRHLAPLAVLGGLIVSAACGAAPGRPWRVALAALLLAAETGGVAASGAWSRGGPPPLAAAAAWLAAAPAGTAVATNEGVFLLRDGLHAVRVYDMHYPADAALGLATAAGPAFRLTATPVAGAAAAAIFIGRFPGEQTLTLYRAGTPGLSPPAWR